MGKVNSILFCVDSNDQPREWLNYAIQSIRKYYNRKDELRIYVASDSPYSNDDVVWIDATKHFHKLNLDVIKSRPYHKGMCNPMILFRLMIPMIDEFADSHILYMDCDTEIVDSRFFDIFDEEFDSDLAGVWDYPDFSRRKMNQFANTPDLFSMMRKNGKERIGRGEYANSGILLFDVPHIRKMRPHYSVDVNRLLDMMLKYRLFWDQDIINIYFSIHGIKRAYNMFPKRYVDGDDAYLIHYVANRKLREFPYPPKSDREMILK